MTGSFELHCQRPDFVIPIAGSCHRKIAQIQSIMVDDYPIATELRIFISDQSSVSEYTYGSNLLLPVSETQVGNVGICGPALGAAFESRLFVDTDAFIDGL